MNELQQTTDAVLTGSIPPSLKAVIKRLYSRGCSKVGLASSIKAMIANAGGDPGGLLGLAIEAYIEQL